MTVRIPTAVARKDFAAVLRSCSRGDRVKLTRYDKTVAVVIPKQALAALEDCEKARSVEATTSDTERRPSRSRATARRSSEK